MDLIFYRHFFKVGNPLSKVVNPLSTIVFHNERDFIDLADICQIQISKLENWKM